MKAIDEITRYMMETAANRYGDVGNVSQFQHALQCAQLAESEGGSPALITAALLHDIGHVVDKHFDGAAAAGIDRQHEQIGSAYLAKRFGPAVVEPVRLHVEAKRYLCAVDRDYHGGLSFGSVRSLELQGGLMSAPEASAFVDQPFAKDAIRLRRWDDLAKDPAATTADLDHFLSFVSVALAQRSAA